MMKMYSVLLLHGKSFSMLLPDMDNITDNIESTIITTTSNQNLIETERQCFGLLRHCLVPGTDIKCLLNYIDHWPSAYHWQSNFQIEYTIY